MNLVSDRAGDVAILVQLRESSLKQSCQNRRTLKKEKKIKLKMSVGILFKRERH